eukprot:PhM_4_TR2453/c0_g1_i1/m.65009
MWFILFLLVVVIVLLLLCLRFWGEGIEVKSQDKFVTDISLFFLFLFLDFALCTVTVVHVLQHTHKDTEEHDSADEQPRQDHHKDKLLREVKLQCAVHGRDGRNTTGRRRLTRKCEHVLQRDGERDLGLLELSRHLHVIQQHFEQNWRRVLALCVEVRDDEEYNNEEHANEDAHKHKGVHDGVCTLLTIHAGLAVARLAGTTPRAPVPGDAGSVCAAVRGHGCLTRVHGVRIGRRAPIVRPDANDRRAVAHTRGWAQPAGRCVRVPVHLRLTVHHCEVRKDNGAHVNVHFEPHAVVVCVQSVQNKRCELVLAAGVRRGGDILRDVLIRTVGERHGRGVPRQRWWGPGLGLVDVVASGVDQNHHKRRLQRQSCVADRALGGVEDAHPARAAGHNDERDAVAPFRCLRQYRQCQAVRARRGLEEKHLLKRSVAVVRRLRRDPLQHAASWRAFVLDGQHRLAVDGVRPAVRMCFVVDNCRSHLRKLEPRGGPQRRRRVQERARELNVVR